MPLSLPIPSLVVTIAFGLGSSEQLPDTIASSSAITGEAGASDVTTKAIVASGTGVEYGSHCVLPLEIADGVGFQYGSSISVPSIMATGVAGILPFGVSHLTLMHNGAGGVAHEGPTPSINLNTPHVIASGSAISGSVTNIQEVPQALPHIVASGFARTGAVGRSSATRASIIARSSGPTVSIQSVPNLKASSTAVAGQVSRSAAWRPTIVASSTGSVQVIGSSRQQTLMPTSGSYAIAGQSGASSTSLARLIVAASGISGALASSSVTLPLMVQSGSGFIPMNGVSVNVDIPLIVAQSTAKQSAIGNFYSIAMHTETQALAEYQNFPFNSFAKFNGLYLAAGTGGIFALGGDTDDGAFIDAVARVGVTDFGTHHLKRVDRAIVGLRTDGEVILRVTVDEDQQFDYKLIDTRKAGLHGTHTKFGRGLVGRYWQFEIQNRNGADFEINMIDLKLNVLQRSIGGRDA